MHWILPFPTPPGPNVTGELGYLLVNHLMSGDNRQDFKALHRACKEGIWFCSQSSRPDVIACCQIYGRGHGLGANGLTSSIWRWRFHILAVFPCTLTWAIKCNRADFTFICCFLKLGICSLIILFYLPIHLLSCIFIYCKWLEAIFLMKGGVYHAINQ